MSLKSWLHSVFVPQNELEDGQEAPVQESKPFVWNEHMRIVLALVVVFISAMIMWWILV